MEPKQLPDDFKDFIASLNKHEVVYLLVGGWAIGIYGHLRVTKDIDFLVATDDTNLERLQGALYDFGAPHPWIRRNSGGKMLCTEWEGRRFRLI